MRHHAQEALNFQIMYLLVWLAASIFFWWRYPVTIRFVTSSQVA